MKYILQHKLYSILENLQNKINEGYFNSNVKLESEAISVVTKIRNEYNDELNEYNKKCNLINNNQINVQELIIDRTFGEAFFRSMIKDDIENVFHILSFIAKDFLADQGIKWHKELLYFINFCFEKITDKEIHNKYYAQIIHEFENYMYWGFNNDFARAEHYKTYPSGENITINLNHDVIKSEFENYIIDVVSSRPQLIELLINKNIPVADGRHYELRVFETTNVEIILLILIKNVDIIKYLPEDQKNNFLINLFTIEQNKNLKEFLYPSYKNNKEFCSIFE